MKGFKVKFDKDGEVVFKDMAGKKLDMAEGLTEEELIAEGAEVVAKVYRINPCYACARGRCVVVPCG